MPHKRRPGPVPHGSPSRHVWVLSGGGARGAAQVGAMQALLEAGITPHALVGCSVGALNAAFLAAAPTPEQGDDLAERWLAVCRSDVFGRRVSGLRNLVRRQSAVLSSEPLTRLIDAWLPVRTFEELAVPLRVVTTSLSAGASVYHDAGALLPVLLASAALPGLLPPVPLPRGAGRGEPPELHVDGGITDLVPVAGALPYAPTDVWVLDVAARAGLGTWRPRNPVDVVVASLSTSMRARPWPDTAGVRVHRVHLQGEIAGPGALMDFGRTRELIDEGRDTTLRALAQQPSPAAALAVAA